MQSIRTLAIVVLCVFALCCADVVLAANSVVDSNGRVWCVRSVLSPLPMVGQEIYLDEEEAPYGEFITMDKIFDTTPHVFLTPAGKIGIVWSRENVDTGIMEICSTIYDQASGLWIHPFTILTNPEGNVDHTDPRMEMSLAGIAHLVYVATSVEGGRTVSSLIYRINENGSWSEPQTVSGIDESVEKPELYLGASDQGYPLMLVYLSRLQSDGSVHLNQSSQSLALKSLKKNGGDPDPFTKFDKHLLPINTR